MTLTPTVVTVTKSTPAGVPQVILPAGQTIVTVTSQQVKPQVQVTQVTQPAAPGQPVQTQQRLSLTVCS